MFHFSASVKSIAWKSFSHAYGSAEDVPDLLQRLTDVDPEIRGEAYSDGLLGALWHQGTIYEASAHAVPFLVELLDSPSVPDRGRIAIALTLMAIAARRAVGGESGAGSGKDGTALLRELRAAEGSLSKLTDVPFFPMVIVALAQSGPLPDLAEQLKESGREHEFRLLSQASTNVEEACRIFEKYAPRFETEGVLDEPMPQKDSSGKDVDDLDWDTDWEMK